MGHLLDALARGYDVLAFGRATDGDEVFRQLVLARIIEPVSKLDSLRVLEEAGVAAASYATLKRRLPAYAKASWRQKLSGACAALKGYVTNLRACPDGTPVTADFVIGAYHRLFEIEHMFRFFQQVSGWTRPRLRDPAAADRWTWLILACYAQLRLARHLAADLRLPWQRRCPSGRLTPARVRRGFRNIRQALPDLASAPKPGKPGPGRPPGSKNRRPATRHDEGKTVKRNEPKKKPAGRRVK